MLFNCDRVDKVYFYFVDLPEYVYCINSVGYVQPEVSPIITMELPLVVKEQPSSYGTVIYIFKNVLYSGIYTTALEQQSLS